MRQIIKMDRGFTLIESLISIFLIAVTAVIFLLIFQTRLTIVYATHLEKASVIALKEMERLRSFGFDNLPGGGAVSDSQLSDLPQGTATRTVSTYEGNSNMKSVSVQVQWLEGNQTETYQIDTIMSK